MAQGVTVAQALAVLRGAARSPRAKAALRTIEGEVEGHATAQKASDNMAQQQDRARQSRGQDKSSAGGNGFPPKDGVRQEFGGGPTGAKGRGSSASPFEKRRKRQGRATAQKGSY